MKFTTFERQAKITINRLNKIKERVEILVVIPDLTEEVLLELNQYEEESQSQYANLDKSLSRLISTEFSSEEDDEQISQIQDKVSEIFISIKVLIKSVLSKHSGEKRSSNNSPQSNLSLKLPPLMLKTFNGSPEQWLSFHSLFEASVHKNKDLSDTEKLQYLLSFLHGEPLNLVKNLPITSDNYKVVWDILNNRYKNNRTIIIHYVNRLIDLPQISNPTSKNIRAFISHFQENSQALLALNHDVKEDNIILSTLLLRKLDSNLCKKFEDSRVDAQQIPQVQDIISFLENECSHMEAASLAHHVANSLTLNPKHGISHQGRKHAPSRPSAVLMSSSHRSLSCSFCGKNDHNIYRCVDFQSLSSHQKFEFVKKRNFCFNCLGTSHNSKECSSKKTCNQCGRKHHSWLHMSGRNDHVSTSQPNKLGLPEARPTNQPLTVDSRGKNPVVGFSQKIESKLTTILLGTTLVQLHSNSGNSLVVRGVVDSGSMISCVSEHAARLLSLKRCSNELIDVDGLASLRIKTKGVSRIRISALNGSEVAYNHPVVILEKITSNLPHTPVPIEVTERYKNLVLADPTFHLPSSIDILIGADLFSKIMTGERLVIADNLPAAMNSVFGYIIVGPAPICQNVDRKNTSLLTTSLHDSALHKLMQRFWILEEPPLQIKPSLEEEACESHYVSHHSRDTTGRYIVRLPFKPNHTSLGNSADTAKRRFLTLEKRFESDEKLKTDYVNCMRDYINSGHMKLVTDQVPKEPKHFFLPHHAVIKEESTSTKVRVVFDASAKTSTGFSLNQTLFSGPKLQNNLNDVLMRFRFHPIVFLCDIRQMFRQIQMHPDDCNYQLLFWRENSSKPLLTYCLTTVVFGFICSPFLALRTLKQLIQDEGTKYPRAASALENQVYVDDLILGANSLEEAMSLQREVVDLLAAGCFDLRKWISNQPELVNHLPGSHLEQPLYFLCEENPLFSVLGLKWISSSDNFAYKIQSPSYHLPTKRNILATVAQIFDPCGFLTPITFWTKALIQLLWTLGLQWDEPVPIDIAGKWKKFCSQLPNLDNLFIARYLNLFEAVNIQLHGFSDGSEAGFSAVVYVRTVSPDGAINVSLLVAKSRVAPLKKISVPRLELCGAHLMAGLLSHSTQLLSQHCKIDSVTAYSDSSVVLSWIQTPPYRLKVYVANRISQIQDLTPPHLWCHISSQFNPADCASRGILPSDLLDHKLWWHGPPWLSQLECKWPTPCFTPVKKEELPEIKSEPLPVLVTELESDIFQRFSSWSVLLRIVAYILRFLNNTKRSQKKVGSLNISELDEACIRICKVVQRKEFKEDINRLRSKNTASPRLQSLSPFLDDSGLIRVGGRIQQSHLKYEAKHPIIMPKTHHVVNLLVDYYHLKYLHAGPQFLQAHISQKFWILSARSTIRQRIYKCINCFRCRPSLATQKMGELPQVRLTQGRVFLNTGSDFLGPFLIKPNSLRKSSAVKMYICVFICLSVKAVHLEVVSSLSTEAFIAALTRFVSRRGLIANLYSDCGTNYVGAASELKKLFKNEESKRALDNFSQENGTIFHFLPPAAPHQGGLWERTVRSIKHHLRRVIGEQIFNFEEFITLTSRVEAILNSRPLTPLSADPSELDCLTPGHFLIGGPLIALPEPRWEDVPSNRLSRWQLIQATTQNFWRRWSTEYLHTLQQRGKWTSPKTNLKTGDLVLIHEPNTPPLSWRLGRITSTSPGSDGLVRVVHLHTARGPISRPIAKVSPLPLED